MHKRGRGADGMTKQNGKNRIEKVPIEQLEPSSEAQREVIISFNPNSGAKNRLAVVEELEERLVEAGFSVVIPKTLPELFESGTASFEAGRLRAIVAAGGDGTVSMLTNHLPAGVPIAILPLGTENLLAKYLTLDGRLDRLVETISEGRSLVLDVGKANGKIFLVMASCGFDADVVRRLHRNRKGHIRHWSYAGPIVGSMGNYKFPRIRIEVDGETMEAPSKWAFIFNAPRYAMNLPIVDEADTRDGLLDLCTFRGGNVFQGLMYLAGVSLGVHQGWKDFQTRRAKSIKLTSDGEVPYQLDGDPGGFLPLEISTIPGFLRVLLPKSRILRPEPVAGG